MKKDCPVFIKRFCCIFIALLLLPCFSQASNWKTYPYQDPHSAIVFPTDEGSHLTTGNLANTNLEWWYFVIHAVGQTTGDKYAIVVDSVNNGGRFFTITDLTKNTHASATYPGTITSATGSLNLTHTTLWGTDYMRTKKDSSGNLVPFEYEFETKGGSYLPISNTMNIKGTLVSLKPPMMAGGNGYVSIGYAGESWYYSLTRLTVNAVLTFNGTTENITGQGWFDHQWGAFKLSPYESSDTGFETYEWFCLQFDDNSEIMISNIYDRNNNLPYGTKYGGVQYYDPDGVSTTYALSTLTRTGYWYDSESGYYMSMGWTLDVPEKNIKLKLTPESTNQMVTIPLHSSGNFFEGSLAVTGTVGSTAVTGKGFGELLHRFKIPSLSVTVNNYPAKSTYATNETIQVSWVVNNPDAGNPLKYDVELVSANSRISIAKGIKTNTVAYTLGQTIPAGTFRIKVTAYSVDKVLQSNVFSPYLTKLQ